MTARKKSAPSNLTTTPEPETGRRGLPVRRVRLGKGTKLGPPTVLLSNGKKLAPDETVELELDAQLQRLIRDGSVVEVGNDHPAGDGAKTEEV